MAEENEIEVEIEEMTMVEIPEEELEFEDTEDGGAVVMMEKVTVRDASEHFANIVDDKPPELAMYFTSAPIFFKFGIIVELVKFPAPIIPMTPFFPSKDF